MENKNQKKSGNGLGFLIVIILMLLSGLSKELEGEVVEYFAAIAGIVILLWLIKKLSTWLRSTSKKDSTPVPVRSMKRHEPKVEIHRDFPVPEAHCVVCENTGEDHFDRDRQMRLSQLDEWLKNGLIDRAEYAVLKRKFEQS